MSEVTLNVLDAARAVHGRTHGGVADRLLAALSADPETIEELEAALARFQKPVEGRSVFQGWASGTDEELWDAGLVVIDLAARLVVFESSYSTPLRVGQEWYHDGERCTDIGLPFHLAEDWLLLAGRPGEALAVVAESNGDEEPMASDEEPISAKSAYTSSAYILPAGGWRALAEARRRERLTNPPLDSRAVIFGKLPESLATECLAERRRVRKADFGEVGLRSDERVIREIHIRWMMTPRDDLRGQLPREVFFAQRHHLEMDLQYRAHAWSFLGSCPPGISRKSHAFRFGGFGTHEWVIHYELTRLLLDDCWSRLSVLTDVELEAFSLSDEIARLVQLQDDWLNSPHMEFHGMTPEQVIIHERCRLPIAMGGEHAMVDDDCPVCRMMASGEFGPMFWHLDGCNMDDDFAFSYLATREEYDEQQRKHEEWSRRFNEEHAEEIAREQEKHEASIWKTSYFDPYSMVTSGKPGPGLWVMGIGMHVSELTEDLKAAGRDDLRGDLNQFFDNLHESYRNQPELFDPAAMRFDDCLASIRQACSSLAEKCEDLQRQLDSFSESFHKWLENLPPGWREATNDSDGLPF